jgi:hypothetical protein
MLDISFNQFLILNLKIVLVILNKSDKRVTLKNDLLQR